MWSQCAPAQTQSSQHREDELFYTRCRAAYLSVFKSSLTDITSKEQLCVVLQQAGRNPSQQAINNYWTPRTTKLNFDDFCEILKKESETDESELLKTFGKMDPRGSGCISHGDLCRVLTSRGEKMSPEELNGIFSLREVNSDGKLDYIKLFSALEYIFCRLLVATVEQCQAAAVERLEADARQKWQNFGSQSEGSPKRSVPQTCPPVPEIPQKSETDTRPSSRPSSARTRRSSVSNAVTVGGSSAKSSRLVEPKSLQDWHCSSLKGCFFLEEDGGIVSLQYRLRVPQATSVFLTIQPLNLSQADEKPSSWMNVDTALFVATANETKEDFNFVCCTELRDKEKFGWKGELSAGTYYILPFTTGCRLKGQRKPVAKVAQLVYRGESGELVLTKEFRAALSDIFEIIDLDGNGLLSLEEYNFFEQRTSGEKCDEDAWAICRENFDTKRNELTRQGFMELNLMEANDREGDPSDLWVTLESMGYNRALEMVEACPFTVSVYTEAFKPTLQPVSLESGHKILNTALCQSVIAKGEARPIKGHQAVVVYTYRSEARISSVISNKSNQKVIVHVNNEQSKNCTSSRGMNVFAVEVPARTKMVCQHIMPTNEKQEWSYSCVESIVM
uniref:EF-hand calcium-binding domain-containing protein 7 n=1 Tax=Scleropages formosus TaxID=113540 RepID=A0A8C9QRP0_SCLFO